MEQTPGLSPRKKRDNKAGSPSRIRSTQRQAQALELRKAGAKYQAIADQLGYSSAQSAAASIKAALRKAIREPADELREMELERLDHMLLVLWPRVQEGDLAAMDRAMRIQLRIADLAGYDRQHVAQQQTNVIVIDGDSKTYVENLKQLRDDAMTATQRTVIGVGPRVVDAESSEFQEGGGSDVQVGEKKYPSVDGP